MGHRVGRNVGRSSCRCVWAGVWLVLCGVLLGAAAVLTLARTEAEAQAPVPGLIPLPARDHDKAVILQALAVDLYFSDGEEPALRTEVRFRLQNTEKTRAARAHVQWVGVRQDGGALPPMALALGTDVQAAEPYSQPTFEHTLAPDERLWVSLVYTEPLPVAMWTHLRYGVSQLAAWPGGVGSVRVTLHFEDFLPQEAMLAVVPEPDRYNGQVWDWQWDAVVPEEDVDVTFVRPRAWAEVEKLRQEARGGDVAAAITLARQLTEAVVDPQTPTVVAETFYPEAVALWTEVAKARPHDPEPWLQLAALYGAQAATAEDAEMYQALRVAALKAAWDRGARDQVPREELAAAIAAQARRYAERQLWPEAFAQVDTLRDVLGPEGEAQVQALRQEIALAWALDSARSGDEQAFQEAIRTGWGDAALGYFLPQRPPLRYVGVEVETTDTLRRITLTLTLDPSVTPDPERDWQALVAYVASRVPEVVQTTNRQGQTAQAVWTFRYRTPGDIRRVQEQLVAGMPDAPAWSLARAALQPPTVEHQARATWWGEWHAWQEEVDLTAPRQALDQAIQNVDVSLAAVPADALPDALWPLLRAQREEDKAAWEALRDYSDVVFRYRWSRGLLPPLSRRWQLGAGERAAMVVTWPVVLPERVVGAALFVLLAWTGVTWALWRWLGRR